MKAMSMRAMTGGISMLARHGLTGVISMLPLLGLGSVSVAEMSVTATPTGVSVLPLPDLSMTSVDEIRLMAW